MKNMEWSVVVTQDDVRFIEKAKEHYDMFAETSQRQGEVKIAGLFLKQSFYAERLLLRIRKDEKP